MEEEGRNGDGAREDSHDGVDSISLLPDAILQTILSSLETKIAIRTCILSKRWRHVWSGTPSLHLDLYRCGPEGDSFNKFIERYTVRKMLSFKLRADLRYHSPYTVRWIEFAMSRNVEKMSLDVSDYIDEKYQIPDLFYINNSIRQISYVSWTSLKMLSLTSFKLDGECIDRIISGCPVLESLSLSFDIELMVLDLSKSLSLRKLDINSDIWFPGPLQIVAPNIRCLRLRNARLPCTLVDVSSLNEVELEIYLSEPDLEADYLQVQMLEKLQNVEKHTFGENFLKILSVAELRCAPFPSFKVKNLTLVIKITKYVIPGIVRVLQNSPELKKLTIIHTTDSNYIREKFIDIYLNSKSLNLDQCWSVEARVFEDLTNWDIESKHVALFMELMFKHTKTLEKMVVCLECNDRDQISEELLEMVPVLSEKNNVTIMIISIRNEPKPKSVQTQSSPTTSPAHVSCTQDKQNISQAHPNGNARLASVKAKANTTAQQRTTANRFAVLQDEEEETICPR